MPKLRHASAMTDLHELPVEALIDEAWARLVAGVGARHPFHLPVVACLDPAGAVTARTVVLRYASAETWTLGFHTDARGPKARALREQRGVAWVVYDPSCSLQVRADSTASVHVGDEVARAAWEATNHGSRRCYLMGPAPGDRLDRAERGDVGTDYSMADTQPAFANFCVVRCQVQRLEWLHLSAQGHRRAELLPDGRVSWLAP